LQQEDDKDHGDASDGKVDVEAPSPGDFLGKGTAEERAGDRGDSPHSADEAKGKRALFKGHCCTNNTFSKLLGLF
jgi:hypothetical protein